MAVGTGAGLAAAEAGAEHISFDDLCELRQIEAEERIAALTDKKIKRTLQCHKYYVANKDSILAYRKEYYKQHREQELSRMRAQRDKNLEYARQYSRSYSAWYYEQNRDNILAKRREKYAQNKAAKAAAEEGERREGNDHTAL